MNRNGVGIGKDFLFEGVTSSTYCFEGGVQVVVPVALKGLYGFTRKHPPLLKRIASDGPCLSDGGCFSHWRGTNFHLFFQSEQGES